MVHSINATFLAIIEENDFCFLFSCFLSVALLLHIEGKSNKGLAFFFDNRKFL